MFDRDGALSLTGFAGSGADWLDRCKPMIEDGQTVVVSPHKVYGPETNDLALQLRKRGITKVILTGMSANLAWRPTSASSWKRASRSPWSKMPPQRRGTRSWETATGPRS